MLHSPPVSSSLSPAIATSLPTNVVNLTASINGSPTISTRSYPQSASRPLLKQSNENKILVSRYIMELAVFWTKRLRAVTRTRRWMSLSAKLSRSLLVLAPSTHVCSWVPPSAKNHSSRIPCFLLLLALAVRQPPPALSSRACPGAAAHILLHSPRGSAVTRPASGPPLPPLSSSHSSRRTRRAAAHTVVSPCPVRTAPRYSARFPPAACAASCLQFC